MKEFVNCLLEKRVHHQVLTYKVKHELKSNSDAVADMLQRLKE